MLGTAIRNRWLTDEHKPAAMEAISKGLESSDDRVRQAAVRNLIAMESQNQKDQHAQLDEFTNRVLTIAQRCGIDVDLLGVGQRAIGSAEDRDASDPGTLQG